MKGCPVKLRVISNSEPGLLANRLKNTLTGSGINADIMKYSGSGMKIARETREAAWTELFSEKIPWVGVIGDQAVLSRDFEHKVNRVIKYADHRGFPVVSLLTVHNSGVSSFGDYVVIKGKIFYFDLALLMNRELAEMYEDFRLSTGFSFSHGEMLGKMFEYLHIDVFCPWPNIVDNNTVVDVGKKHKITRETVLRRSINFMMG